MAWQPPTPTFQRLLNSIRGGIMGQNEYRVLNKPRVSLGRVTALSPGAGPTFPTWDQLEYDTDSMANGAAGVYNNIKVNTPGIYLFTAWWMWAANAVGYREIWFQKGTGQIYDQNVVMNTGAGVVVSQTIASYIPMNKGDVCSLALAQGSGGVLAGVMNTNPVATNGLPGNGFQAVLASTL